MYVMVGEWDEVGVIINQAKHDGGSMESNDEVSTLDNIIWDDPQ